MGRLSILDYPGRPNVITRIHISESGKEGNEGQSQREIGRSYPVNFEDAGRGQELRTMGSLKKAGKRVLPRASRKERSPAGIVMLTPVRPILDF